MAVFDKFELEKISRETGFMRDNLEKVYRLTEVLSYFHQDELLRDRLALKGGTAINLTVLNMPRLSVDIDLDFEGECSREEMLESRARITDDIQGFMAYCGYALHPSTKNPHSLDSWVYMYRNAGGNIDNIKIEINYLMRNHVLPTIEVPLTVEAFSDIRIRTLDRVELFASKIKAFIERQTCRDLYDINMMIRKESISESDHTMLRKMVVFYLAVGGSTLPKQSYDLSFCDKIKYPQVRATLLPMLRKTERFDYEDAVIRVRGFLTELLQWGPEEMAFIENFNSGKYSPELLFSDESIVCKVKRHPMAAWKMHNNNK